MVFSSLWWPVALIGALGLASLLGVNALLISRGDELGWRRVLRLSAGLSIAIALGTLWLGAVLSAMSWEVDDVVVVETDSFEAIEPPEAVEVVEAVEAAPEVPLREHAFQPAPQVGLDL